VKKNNRTSAERITLPGAPPYFEELAKGQRFSTSGYTVTEDAIIRFALEWDCQPFHVDRLAAEQSIYKGLVASGLHTAVITQRLIINRGLFTGTVVAGFEWGRMRFVQPVRPGDTVYAAVSVDSRRASRSRPGFGIVKWGILTFNQSDEVVLETSATNLVACRPSASSTKPTRTPRRPRTSEPVD
jgi:acyl dehydratase